MAQRLIAPLAPGIELKPDYVLRLVALNPTTGAAVAGVTITAATMQVDKAPASSETPSVQLLPPLLASRPVNV